MLVLSREPGESILIGEDITITVVRIGPNTVRIGITAPRSMNIVRTELIDVRLAEGEGLDVAELLSEANPNVNDNYPTEPIDFTG